METPSDDPIPEAELLPEPEPVAKRWPIHQRLIGAAVRAGVTLVGALPLALWVLHKEFYRWEWEWLWGLLLGGLFAFVLFAFEKRGSSWWRAALRLSATTAVFLVLAPMAWVWLDNIGDPAQAYDKLTRFLRPGRLFSYSLGVLGTAVYLPMLGLWFYVRNRSASLLPQVLAGVLTVLLPTVILFADRPSRNVGWAFWLFTAGALIALAAWLGDKAARRFDPEAPPPTGSDVRPIFAAAGVLVWLALSVPLGLTMSRSSRFGSEYTEVVRSLSAIAAAQNTYRARNADNEFAGNLPELIRSTSHSGQSIGVRKGFVYRLIRSRNNPDQGWAATADSIEPGFGNYVINQDGVVYRAPEPVWLDPYTCSLPGGLERAR